MTDPELDRTLDKTIGILGHIVIEIKDRREPEMPPYRATISLVRQPRLLKVELAYQRALEAKRDKKATRRLRRAARR